VAVVDQTEHDAGEVAVPPRSGIAGDVADVREVLDKSEWDALVSASPHPHLPQTYAYGEGKLATGWTVRRVAFYSAGRAAAFATVLQLRRFGVTLVNRVNRGPVFLQADPSPEQIVAVHDALRRKFGRFWRGLLLIAPTLPKTDASRALLRRAGYRLRHEHAWQSGRIDLRQSEDALWKSFASTFRNRVRNAEKAGAAVQVANDADTFEWMIARHLENMSEKKFSAVGGELLRAMRRASPEDVLVFQLIHNGQPVAGMSVVRFGRIAEYHIGWFGPEGRKLNAGNFLMWQVMREMKRRGVEQFDVGGLKPGDGYTRFKQTMHPVEYELAGEWWSI